MINLVHPFIETNTFYQASTKYYNGICYDVLDYNGFEKFKINGLLNLYMTKSFKKKVLEKVGTRNPLFPKNIVSVL